MSEKANPYQPGPSEIETPKRIRRKNRNCPVCSSSIPMLKRLLPLYRCKVCRNRLSTRPLVVIALLNIVLTLVPFYCFWQWIREEPMRMLDVGYWIMLPPMLMFIIPYVVNGLSGFPTLIKGSLFGWANQSDLIAARARFDSGKHST